MAERLVPFSIVTQTNLSGTVVDLTDDPDSPDVAWWTAPGTNNNTVCHVAMTNPANNLRTGAGLQEIRVLVRKTTGNTAPTATLDLYENGTLVTTLFTGSVTSTAGTVISGTFNASLLSNINGSGVEVRVSGAVGGGTPSQRASLEVGAVEWNAEEVVNVSISPSVIAAPGASIPSVTVVAGTGLSISPSVVAAPGASVPSVTVAAGTGVSISASVITAPGTSVPSVTVTAGTSVTVDLSTGCIKCFAFIGLIKTHIMRPTGVFQNLDTASVVGAADFAAALSDSSDSSYVIQSGASIFVGLNMGPAIDSQYFVDPNRLIDVVVRSEVDADALDPNKDTYVRFTTFYNSSAQFFLYCNTVGTELQTSRASFSPSSFGSGSGHPRLDDLGLRLDYFGYTPAVVPNDINEFRVYEVYIVVPLADAVPASITPSVIAAPGATVYGFIPGRTRETDDFNRADELLNVSSAWDAGSNAKVIDGRLKLLANTATAMRRSTPVPDFQFQNAEVEVNFVSEAGSKLAGVLIAAEDTGTDSIADWSYFLLFMANGTNVQIIQHISGGTSFNLKTSHSFTVKSGDRLRIERPSDNTVVGKVIRAGTVVDTLSAGVISDSEYLSSSNSYVGLYSETTNVEFDNWSTDPASGAFSVGSGANVVPTVIAAPGASISVPTVEEDASGSTNANISASVITATASVSSPAVEAVTEVDVSVITGSTTVPDAERILHYPSSTPSISGWTVTGAATAHEALDVSESSYVSASSGVASLSVALGSITDPGLHSSGSRARLEFELTQPASQFMTMGLVQASSNTTIASVINNSTAPVSNLEVSYELTQSEFDSISDWSDLDIRAIALPSDTIQVFYARLSLVYSPDVLIGIGVSVSPSVITADTSVPTPTASAGTDVTVSPSVVTATSSIPSLTPSAGATVSASVIATATSVGTATPAAPVTLSPSVISAVTFIPTPTVAVVTTFTIWDHGSVSGPTTPATDSTDVTLGVVIEITQDCQLTHLHQWTPDPNYPVAAKLWLADGTEIANWTPTWDNAGTQDVWQTYALPSPVSLDAGQTYILGHFWQDYINAYPASNNYFTVDVDSGPLHVPDSAEATADGNVGNGRYDYNTGAIVLPSSTFNSSNYWLDVTVSTLVPTEVTPAVISGVGSIPTPTVSAGTGASASPSVILAVTSIPSPTLIAPASAAPSVVSAVTTVGTATTSAGTGASVTAITVDAVTTVGTPTVTAGGAASVTATVVTGITSVGTAAIEAHAKVVATVVSLVGTVPAPTVASGTGAILTATVVTAVTSVGTATASSSTDVTSVVIDAVTTVGSATITAGTGASITAVIVLGSTSFGTATISAGQQAVVTAVVILSTTSVGTPSLVADVTISVAVVLSVTDIRTPSVTEGGGASVVATVIEALTSVGTVTVLAGQQAVVTAVLIDLTTSIGSAVTSVSYNVLATEFEALTSVGTASVSAGSASNPTPSVILVITSVGSPTITAGQQAVVTATLIDLLSSVGTAVLSASTSVTPERPDGVTSVPSPVLDAGTGAVVSVELIDLVSTVETAVASASVEITTANVAAATSVGTATASTGSGSQVSASVIDLTTSVGTATPSAATNTAPAVVSSVTAVNTASIEASSNAIGAIIILLTSIGSPSITAGGSVSINANVIQAVTSTGTVTVAAGANVDATIIDGQTFIGSATVTTGTGANVSAAVVAGVSSVGTPTLAAGTGYLVSATVVAGASSVPTPTLLAGGAAHVTASVVPATTAFGSATVSAQGNVVVTVSSISAVTSTGSATVSAGARPTPVVIIATSSIGTAAISASALIDAVLVTGVATVEIVSLSISHDILASSIDCLSSIGTPTFVIDTVVTPGAILCYTTMGTLIILAGGQITYVINSYLVERWIESDFAQRAVETQSFSRRWQVGTDGRQS